MSTGEDEPSSGLNGRLRPRKSNVPSPQSAKITRKLDTKPYDKPKRITPSKVTPSKPDDLTNKSDSPSPQILCPYCDKIFYAKQAVSKHIRRIHLSTSKQDYNINCLFCNHTEGDGNDIIRHMVDNHPNQYFACYDCHTRFPSTTELAEHKLNVCEKQKLPYRNKLRKKTPKKGQKAQNNNGRNNFGNDDKNFSAEHGFNRIVISCELKPSHPNDPADIEDNITTNLILPPSKSLGNATVIEKNAVIVLDDLQWNKRIPPNFSFHNTDADQILSRLGVVHRSPRAGESNRREWFKNMDESNQKFEKCFDTSFYSKVASNVQENLSKFLDGTFNFNPDPENTIKTRKAKNSVPINTVEGFPILLTCEQFNRNIFDAYMPRAIAPKHKWKWDNLESDKSLMSPEQLKRDSHTNNCIITLVSSLDIWTQLCMRRKFEEKFNLPSIEKKTEKQNIIGKELKEILESRELPTSSSQVVKYTERPVPAGESLDFPSSLGLVPNKPSYELKPAVLSGEWVRPRCYVCCACGAQTRDSKALSSHISNHHQNAQIQHYEIVGEVLLNSDILKHLYVPPSQMNNRTRPLRGFRECTKCKKSITLEDLHQHMLDCAGDTPTVRRKCRYRPFGMRKRRSRLPDNNIRKKIRKDIRSRHTRKNHMRPRQKIRSEVGDAETIRKMLADLPAKRHRVMVNPLNPILRPRRKLNKQRNKLVMKKRMMDDVKQKTQINDSSLGSNAVSADPKRVSSDRNDHKINKTRVKRVASKILRHKDSFNKKTSMNRSRRKGPATEEQGTVASLNTPSDGEGNMQNQQSSMHNNSDRININDGSYNKREHSNNNNNGSNNRDNQQPGPSGQNNGSENSSNPSQNVPLKHSIERLTASSDTQDKSVQFHHAFLVQQECNDPVQHMAHNALEERMLFENEAIVTKLDKPPLHFGHQEIIDTQMFNRSKLNKRKGLNDCIAMLKNKLVEPNIGTPPGHVSVQCGTDEPLDPEPVVIERRHSTTDSTFETAQRSLQMHYPNKTLEDTLQTYDTGSRTTRRSYKQEQALRDIQANNDYMQWKLYYDSQMYAAQKNNEQFTRREPSRRRSVVLPEDLLLQHSMNVDILTGKHFRGFPEYNYPNNIKTITPPRPPTRRSRDARSRSRSKVTKETPSRDPSLVSTPRTRRNSRRKAESTTTSATSTPTRRLSEKQIEHTNVGGNLITTENVALGYPQITMTDDRITVVENQILPTHNFPNDQAYHSVRVYQNPPIMQYPNEADIRPLHYNMHIESTIMTPLDLSSKHSRAEDQEATVQFSTEPQYCAVSYDNYETLDLSNRHSVQLHEKEPQINTDDVVDLRVKYTSRPTHLPCFTPVPTDIVSNRVEDNITDLSIRQPCVAQDDDYPTDLSVKRSYPTLHSYEKQGIQNNESDINVIQDLSRPMMQVQHMGTSMSGSHELVREQPTDLSNKRNENSSNHLSIGMSEGQPINLNIRTNTTDLRNEDIPADLSARNKERRHRIYVDSQGTEFYEEIVVNNETGSVHNVNDAQLSMKCINAEQIVRVHYNSSPRTAQCSRSTIMTYSERSNTIDGTQNISTSNHISPTPATCDMPSCNEMVYQHSEMPLSLTINKISEPRAGQCDAVANPVVYEPSQANYIMTNNAQYNTAENLNTNGVQNTSMALTVTLENRESVNTSQSSIPIISHKICNDDIIIHEEDVINDSKKFMPIRKNPALSTIHKFDSEKKITETVQPDSNKTILEQDPETARKIAMLPKELVEILGTMPVDHRNQLLNVLPQYVSTSTSPVLPNNQANSKSSSCNSPNLKSSVQMNDDLEKDHKTDIIFDDGRPLVTNTISMSPTAVSSSILLTPPTPQLPDRNMIQSQENVDIISSKYRTNSRSSADGQVPVTNTDTDKSKAVSNLSSSIKNIVKMDEIDTKERIIDLTVDESSPEDSEIYYNPDPLIHTIPLPNSVKPNAQKPNNDKTASLRAVRIKAPSERQRSMLSETASFKKQTDNMPTISKEKQKPRTSEMSNPMAIQQAEISSTQHRTVVGLPPISPTLDPSPKESSSTRHVQEHIEKDTPVKSDSDIRYSTMEKQNVVTSSLIKDVDNNLKNSKAFKVNTPKISTEIVNVSSSKKNETETDLCKESSGISTQIVMDASPSKTKTILKISNEKSSIEDEDSEDDVTLATIVKKKNQEMNVSVERNNIQLERKKKKTKKTKKVGQINECGSQQNQDEIMSKDDKPSVAGMDLSIDLPENSTKNNDLELTENITNEKITVSKKKSKKGRRTNNFAMTKYMEQQGQIYQTLGEKEVDKENTVSSDTVKSKETIESSVRAKCSNELDSDRSIVTNENLIYDIVAKKENIKKSIEFSSDCNSTRIQVIDRNSEKSEENLISLTNKTHSFNAPETPSNSATNESIANKELKIINNEEKHEVIDHSKIAKSLQVNIPIIQVELNKSEDHLAPQNSMIKDKDDENPTETPLDKPKINDNEDSNTTLLRRSRRGKSLFIDSTTIMNENALNSENTSEHKAPLTKKQLIFSKLLLDEENHNKNSKTSSQEKLMEISLPNNNNKSLVTSDSEVDVETCHGDKRGNKRKKSPQPKRKCKKKKSLISVETTEDTNVEIPVKSVNAPAYEKLSNLSTENIVSTSYTTSHQKHDFLDKKVVEMDKTFVNRDPRLEASLSVQKSSSTEKRKSSSPVKFDLIPSLKPKKSKPNDEVSSIESTTLEKTVGKEIKSVDIKEGATAMQKVTRTTPCYNKSAARRARSKSVVVKSSGTDLYDPYDIDLEDMVEKTEPFIRKETSSKIEFNSFKSTFVTNAKTKKLTKTAPSAIIDISPSDQPDVSLSHVATSIEKDNSIKETGQSTSGFVNTSVSTKDSSSDSDESSKSDIPLKKYVEEKERKLLEEVNKTKRLQESKDITVENEKSDKSSEKSKARKKIKRAQSITNKEETTSSKLDTEEELRSEQFMESFGFFSERKPRKSNLLASKKISETFHIIANESDDVYFSSSKEKVCKKTNDSKKEEDTKGPISPIKKAAKRGRKKKSLPPEPSFCHICKKAFRRSDNYLRHQMALIHISRLSEVELKFKTVKIEEEPNYLIAYKQQLDRLKVLQNKIAKRKKNCISTADIILPTLEEILADVKRTIREQQLSRRGLSRDEALFIDCCTMLKESHTNDQAPVNKRIRNCNSFNCAQTCQEELALLERSISDDRCDIKCDDVDSITAKNILESEEVRNLENDLISNLKEANGLKGPLSNVHFKSSEDYTSVDEEVLNYNDESQKSKSKRQIEVKEKMYPDVVENIDMFEDKFDKIKRKCRSQAAAAKQIQSQVESNISRKNRKKAEKKKGKRSSKKCQSTVPTKGALKGFDGIKVSILTSDINMSAIVPSVGNSFKKKKKSSSKRKRERKGSDVSSKCDGDHRSKETLQNKVDVYEFMDTEDTELFEFRPSTLMERFKSITNKEIPSTSKAEVNQDDLAEASSESGSDVDDFVYMSDDYVCSDDETENSMLSCELGHKKTVSPLKRKDVIEKNAVMGKIFKHNAVRSERRSPKRRETPKPKANMDQLFDSLLQEEPKTSSPAKNNDASPKNKDTESSQTYNTPESPKPNTIKSKYDSSLSASYNSKPETKNVPEENALPDSSNYPSTSSSSKKRKSITPPRKLDLNLIPTTIEYELLDSNRKDVKRNEAVSESRHSSLHSDMPTEKYNIDQSDDEDGELSADEDDNTSPQRDNYQTLKRKEKSYKEKEKPYANKKETEKPEVVERNEPIDETSEDAGVARQRARRKCTVGKQNVLAETWSSESEPDGAPQRPNSAESVIGAGRKRRSRKKDMSCSRKATRQPKRLETERVARPRAPYYWSDGEDEQEHPQQHGWIVGDSHKKLVTMLAHAKGRKRHDDKRQVLE